MSANPRELMPVRRRLFRATRRAVAETEARWRSSSLFNRGSITGPPDFVGVGVQRAGTSWWFAMLEQHPAVHVLGSARKELHFFDDMRDTDLAPEVVDRYHDLFRRPPNMISGEWTPRYMFDAHTPALLRRAAPDAKLLVLLRDPVERFRSGITHAHERGRPVTEAVIAEAAARGRYHEQLERLLQHFPTEQLLVLQFERCRREPQAMLRRTFSFLGIDSDVRPAASVERPRNRSLVKVGVDPDVLAEVTTSYQDDLRRLFVDFPELDPTLWPSVES